MSSCVVRRIVIRNFKSLREFELEIPSRVLVAIGPSASGKSSLVSALGILRNYIDYLRGTSHSILGGYRFGDIVWRCERGSTIYLGLCIECSDVSRYVCEDDVFKSMSECRYVESSHIFRGVRIAYGVEFEESSGEAVVASENFVIEHDSVNIQMVNKRGVAKLLLKSPNPKALMPRTTRSLVKNYISRWRSSILGFYRELERSGEVDEFTDALQTSIGRYLSSGIEVGFTLPAPILSIYGDMYRVLSHGELDVSPRLLEKLSLRIARIISTLVTRDVLPKFISSRIRMLSNHILRVIIRYLAKSLYHLMLFSILGIGITISGVETIGQVNRSDEVSEIVEVLKNSTLRREMEGIVSGILGFDVKLELDAKAMEGMNVAAEINGCRLRWIHIPTSIRRVIEIASALVKNPKFIAIDDFDQYLTPEQQMHIVSEIVKRNLQALLTVRTTDIIRAINPEHVLVLTRSGNKTVAEVRSTSEILQK